VLCCEKTIVEGLRIRPFFNDPSWYPRILLADP
jgi:hypothetical protein